MPKRPRVRVAAACILNDRGEVLVCRRPSHKIYPGEWEFPGGKIERGETAAAALRRELREELDIGVRAARPLIRVHHDYPELSVELDTWLVTRFAGVPAASEHPQIEWVAPGALGGVALLAGNLPIVAALRLPAQYVFTPPDASLAALRRGLRKLDRGSLVRLRQPALDDREYLRRARSLIAVCRAHGLRLILDREPADAAFADGWHATAARVRGLAERPVPSSQWFCASAHSLEELGALQARGADCAVVGPIRPTRTHAGDAGIGWRGFRALVDGAKLPVFAIGGVGPRDLARAWRAGAQGCAGIGAYWPRGGGSSGGSS